MQACEATDQLSVERAGEQAAVNVEENGGLSLRKGDKKTVNSVSTADASPQIAVLENDFKDTSAAEASRQVQEDESGTEKKEGDKHSASATGSLPTTVAFVDVGAGTAAVEGLAKPAGSKKALPAPVVKGEQMVSLASPIQKTSSPASSGTSTPSHSERGSFDAEQPQSPRALPSVDGSPAGMSAPPPPTPSFPAFNVTDVCFLNEALPVGCYDPSQERAVVDQAHVSETFFKAPLHEGVGEGTGRMPGFFYPQQQQRSGQCIAPCSYVDDALPSVLDATTTLVGDITHGGGKGRGYGGNALPSSSSMTPTPASLLGASSSLAMRNTNCKKQITSDVSLVSSSLSSASAPSPGALDPFTGRPVPTMHPPLAQLLLHDFSGGMQFSEAPDSAGAGYGITPETSGHGNTGVFAPLSLGGVPGTISPRENAAIGDPLLLSGLQPVNFEAMSERLSGYHQQRPDSLGSDLNLDTYSSSLSNIHVPPPYSSNNSVSAIQSGESQSGTGHQLSLYKYCQGNERNALLLSPGREKDDSQERRRGAGDPRATFNTMETFQSHPLYQHAQHTAEGFSSMGPGVRDLPKKTHDSVIPNTLLSVSTTNEAISPSFTSVPKFELSEEDVPIDVRSSLVVFYIPHSWTLKRLYDTFAPYGRVLQYRLDTDPETGKRKGRGFIQFDCPESAIVAMNAVNGMVVEDNRRLKVQPKRFMSLHYRQRQILASTQYSESCPPQKWRFPVHSSNDKKAPTPQKGDPTEGYYQCRMPGKETDDLQQYDSSIHSEAPAEGCFTSPRHQGEGRMMTLDVNAQGQQDTMPAACGNHLFSGAPPLMFIPDGTNTVHHQIPEEVSRVGSGSLCPQISSSEASPVRHTDRGQSNVSLGWLSSVLAVVDKAGPNDSRGNGRGKEASAEYAVWNDRSSVRNASNTPSLSASSDSSASSSPWSITSGDRPSPQASNARERGEYDGLSPVRGRATVTLEAVSQRQPRGSSEKPSIWEDRQSSMLPNLGGEEYTGPGGYHLIVQGSGSSPSEGPMAYTIRSRANSTHSPGSRMLGVQRKEVSMAVYPGQAYGDKPRCGSSSVPAFPGEQDLRCSAPQTAEEVLESDILRMLLLPTAAQGTHQRSASEGCCETSFIGDSVSNDIGVGGVATSSSSSYCGTHVGFQTPLSLRQQPSAPWGNFFSSASGMTATATSSAARGNNCGATPFADTSTGGTTAAATLASYENNTRAANAGSSPPLPVNAHFVTSVYKGPGGNSDMIPYNTENGTAVFQDQKLPDISSVDGIDDSLRSVRLPGSLPHDNKHNFISNNNPYYNQDKTTTIRPKSDCHEVNNAVTKDGGAGGGNTSSTLPYGKTDWVVHPCQQEMDSAFVQHGHLQYQQPQHNPWTNQQPGFQDGHNTITSSSFTPQLHDASVASLSFFSYPEAGTDTVVSNQQPSIYPDGQGHDRISVPGDAASMGMQQHESAAPLRPKALHGGGMRRAHLSHLGSQVGASSNNNPSRFSTTSSSARYQQGTIIPDNNLFVFHIPPDWNEAEFRRQFKKFGQIRCLSFPKDFITPWGHKGYGFICYEFQEDALRAIREMDGKEIAVGRRLKVEFKKPLNTKLRAAAATVAVNANPLLRRGHPVLWPRPTKKEGNMVNRSGKPAPAGGQEGIKFQNARHPLPSAFPAFHTEVPMAPEYPHNPAPPHPVNYSLRGVRRAQEIRSSYTLDGQSTTAGCLATPSSVGYDGPLYAVNGE